MNIKPLEKMRALSLSLSLSLSPIFSKADQTNPHTEVFLCQNSNLNQNNKIIITEMDEDSIERERTVRIRMDIKFKLRTTTFESRRYYTANVRRVLAEALSRDVFPLAKDLEFVFIRNPSWERERVVATAVLMMTTVMERETIERMIYRSRNQINSSWSRNGAAAHEIELIEPFDSFRRFETGLRVLRISDTTVDIRWRDKHIEEDTYTLRTYAAVGELETCDEDRNHQVLLKDMFSKAYLRDENSMIKLTKKQSRATRFSISSCESKDGTSRVRVTTHANNNNKNKYLCLSNNTLKLTSNGYFTVHTKKRQRLMIWREISKHKFSSLKAYRADAELGDSDSDEENLEDECYHQLSIRVRDLRPEMTYFFILDRSSSLDFPQQSPILNKYRHCNLHQAVYERDLNLTSVLCFETRREQRERALLVQIEPSHTIGLAPCRLHRGQHVQTLSSSSSWIDAVVSRRCVDTDQPDQFYDLLVTKTEYSNKPIVLSDVSRDRIRVSETKPRICVVSLRGVPYLASRSHGCDVETLYESEFCMHESLGTIALPFRTSCGGEILVSSLLTQQEDTTVMNEFGVSALEESRLIGGYVKFVLERRDAMRDFSARVSCSPRYSLNSSTYSPTTTTTHRYPHITTDSYHHFDLNLALLETTYVLRFDM